MTGLDKIIAAIASDAKADADRVLADAKAECRAIDEDYAHRASELRASMLEEAGAELSDAVARVKSTAAIERRNAVLSAKSELVDEAFDLAVNEVRSMPAEKYRAFLTDILTSVMLGQVKAEENERRDYGGDELETAEAYEVALKKSDRDAHGAELIKAVKAVLVSKDAKEAAGKLRLSESDADIDGGLILRYGDIEVNCSLSMIFSKLKSTLETDVYHILFKE